MSFSYVAIGDSLSVGVGSTIFSPGFVERYKRMAERELDDQINLKVLARPGFQTKDILDELNKDDVKEIITKSEIITITAGQTDLIQAIRKFETDKNEDRLNQAFQNSLENFKKILLTVNKYKLGHKHFYIIRIINLYNPFPEKILAGKWVKKFNLKLKSFVHHSRTAIIDISKTFKDYEKEYLSIDQIYPNDIGYERIAEKLHRIGYEGIKMNIKKN